MIFSRTTFVSLSLALCLSACQPSSEAPQSTSTTNENVAATSTDVVTLIWEDLMPEGEDKVLAELYAAFYEDQEELYLSQLTLSQAANAESEGDLMSMIDEGSAQDTMEQIGTYNVVAELNGEKIRMPGYVVPLDFNAASEYNEFLLVPYFGACLHTPPPPPNQIVFVKSETATKIANINEPVWVEGVMKTGQFGSELGNSAYELTLSKLEPYEY